MMFRVRTKVDANPGCLGSVVSPKKSPVKQLKSVTFDEFLC